MSIKPATENEMLEQGFPKELQTAFKATAEETQCVILSRVPGGATTELIKAGHDLKGYFIKAKSCDWGPMSGFLCQVPAFNKKGVDGIEHNAEKNLAYYEEFCDRLHSPQESLDAQTSSDKKNTDAEERIKSILTDNKLKWQEQWNAHLLGTTPIVTTRAFLKDKSDENAVANLSVLVGDMDEVFIDNPSGPINKSNPEFSKRLNTVVRDLRTLVGDASPFVPLKLTESVFKKFEASNPGSTQTIGDITCGIAYKKTGTDVPQFVFFNYIVKKQNGLYELFHGDIWVYDHEYRLPLDDYFATIGQADPLTCATLGIPTSNSHGGQTISALCGPNASQVELTFRQKYQDFGNVNKELLPHEEHSDRRELFNPIKGIQNYYPPFSGADAYKNAVTGDYDLFACWPLVPANDLSDLVRQSELARKEETSEASLFASMSSKRFSLRSTVSPNVFVEFIPGFGEIKGLEHPSFGNANGLVHLVAGTLNSFVNTVMQKKRLGFNKVPRTVLGRNVAFHSDEGGRPGINAVDYDVAAFVPKALMATGSVAKDLMGQEADKKHTQMFLITKHVDLLTLINAVKPHCYVPLNFAWLYDFLKYDDNTNEKTTVESLLKAVFCSRDVQKQGRQLDSLKKKFTEIFKPAGDGSVNFGSNSEDKIVCVRETEKRDNDQKQ